MTLPVEAMRLSDADAALASGIALVSEGKISEGVQILRWAPMLAPARRRAVEIALRASAADPDFRRLVEQADSRRDRREWPQAIDAYASIMRLYPFHYGYSVQLGHSLKEAERFEEAEIAYRSAYALGAPESEVVEHLAFVANKVGGPASGIPPMRPNVSRTLLELPTHYDVQMLFSLLTGGGPSSNTEVLTLIRSCDTLLSLATRLAGDERTVNANRLFLLLLDKPARA